YAGLAERSYVELDMRTVSGILPLGGTILSTSSYDPFRQEDGGERLLATLELRPVPPRGWGRAGARHRRGGRLRCDRRDRRRAHDDDHAPALRAARPAAGGGPEEDRQPR